MSATPERMSTRDKILQRTQELASSGQRFATSSVRALGDGINDIKANPKVQERASTVSSSVRSIGNRINDIKSNPKIQEGANSVTSSVRLIGDRINDMKTNPKVQEGASNITSSVRSIGSRINDIKTNPKVQERATNVRASVKMLRQRVQELKDSESVRIANKGVKNLGDRLQKINLPRLIAEMERDQNIADDLERVNHDLMEEKVFLDMIREAEEACMQAIAAHFIEFVADKPKATYEQWIADLHPENTHEGQLLEGMEKEVDHRFYVEESDHRLLWNSNLGNDRTFVAVRTMGWTTPGDSDQFDFLSSTHSYKVMSTDNDMINAFMTSENLGAKPTEAMQDQGNDDHLALDLEEENETREVKRQADEVCHNAMMDHFIELVAEKPNITYEQWICDLHPENTHEGQLLAGMDKEVDHRFYVEDSAHRKLWNGHLGSGRQHVSARKKAWTNVENAGQIDLLSSPAPGTEKMREVPKGGEGDDLIVFDNL